MLRHVDSSQKVSKPPPPNRSAQRGRERPAPHGPGLQEARGLQQHALTRGTSPEGPKVSEKINETGSTLRDCKEARAIPDTRDLSWVIQVSVNSDESCWCCAPSFDMM